MLTAAKQAFPAADQGISHGYCLSFAGKPKTEKNGQ